MKLRFNELNAYITEYGKKKLKSLNLEKGIANAHLLNQWQFFGIVEANRERKRGERERKGERDRDWKGEVVKRRGCF